MVLDPISTEVDPVVKTYELPTFLDRPVPVELLAELEDYRVEGCAVILRVRTERHEPLLQNYYGTVAETVFRPPSPGATVTVRLDVCTPQIVRIRSCPGDAVPANDTPMVVGTFQGSPPSVVEDQHTVTIGTGAVTVVVRREPFRLELRDPAGRTIWATRPADLEGFRRPEHQWNPTEQRWLFSLRYGYPPGTGRDGRERWAFASFDLAHDERIHGFGETFGRLDRVGTDQRLWLEEAFSNTSPAAYKRVPFYLSSRGYGLFVHTSNAVRFQVGSLDHTAVSVVIDDTDLFDAYLIYGPTAREILPRYTAITGAPAVPPKWTLGLWMSRITYRTQDEVEQVARDLRAHRIPADVIHIDTGWFAEDYSGDLRFGPQFPDPAGMCARLLAQGFRVTLWQWPNLKVGTTLFAEALAQGFLARQPSGFAYVQAGGYSQDAAILDYSNPDAVAWIQGKFAELFALGVAAIKVDYGEGAPPDAVYAGVPSESMHNRYPLLYGKAVWDATEEAHGRGNATLWARAAWAGSQRYPIHWSGDGVARTEDLACVLRATLSFGLSGFPFYSHDIGGFTGLPSPELFVRWTQLGLFSSHARTHGQPPREPWAYGEQAESLVRRYLELRSRLLPYLWTESVECGRTSLPMVRALLIDFPDDPVACGVDDQYLFGPNLLVAPVLDGDVRRRVYLPAGRWVEYWTKQTVDGGRFLEVAAPLETLPLYVAEGAVLPLGPVMQHTGELPLDPLTVEVYAPMSAGGYTVHQEGAPDIAIRYRRAGDRLVVEVGETPGAVEVVVYGAGPPLPRLLPGPGPHRAEFAISG